MKKFLMPLVIGLCSCTSEHSDVQINEDAKIVSVSIAEMNSEIPNSRLIIDPSLKFWWKSNDVMGIFPQGKGSQVEFPIELEEGTLADKVKFDGGGWAFKGGYTYAAYYPYNLLSNRGNKIPFSYAEQRRNIVGNDFDLNGNVLFVAGPTTVANGAINFVLYNVEALLRVDLYGLPTDKTYKSLSLYAEDEVIPQEKLYNIFSLNTVQEGSSTIVTIDDEVVTSKNYLKMDLQNAAPVNNMIRVWMAFPAIGTKYGSFKAVVEDSDGNLYKGDVLANNTESSFNFDIKRHGKYAAKIKNFTLTDGVLGSIEDWEKGEEILGSAN